MALSGETLDDVVREDMRDEWSSVKRQWFPRTDTKENIAYDKRTPGELCLVLLPSSIKNRDLCYLVLVGTDSPQIKSALFTNTQ